MDFETLERLWRSDANGHAVAETYVVEKTLQTLRRRHWRFTFAMGLAGMGLLAWTAVVSWAQFVRGVVEPGREWAAYGLLAVAWIAYLFVLRQHRRHVRIHGGDLSMLQALHGLLDENRVARNRARFLAGAMVLFGGVLAVAVSQLEQVGKMEPRHVQQAALLFGGCLALSVVLQIVRYFAVLAPEARRLQTLLNQYKD